MGLYTMAITLVIVWMVAIGFIAYHAGGIIYILSVIAVILVITRIIQRKKIF
jgi:hypothetical protein